MDNLPKKSTAGNRKRAALHTAQNGDPGSATRGSAVDRARLALGDELDALISFDRERAELIALAKIASVPKNIRKRLATARLDELQRWIGLVAAARIESQAQSEREVA